jgi:hypothetical protein
VLAAGSILPLRRAILAPGGTPTLASPVPPSSVAPAAGTTSTSIAPDSVTSSAPARQTPRGVYFGLTGGPGEWHRFVSGALVARNLPLSTTPDDASTVVQARVDLSVRPAPFVGVTALTVDYVVTASIRRHGRPPRRCDFEGHALEFGEAVARTAALRSAAERLAECVAGPA